MSSMKIRISSIIILLVFAHTEIKAQIRLALYGGLHSSNVVEKNSVSGWDTATKPYYSPRTGFQLGFLAEIPVGNKGFYFQPGMVWMTKGRNYSKSNDSATATFTDTLYTQSSLQLSYVE